MTAAVLGDEEGNDENKITTTNYIAETDTQTKTETERISRNKNYDKTFDKGKLSWPVTVIRGTQVRQEDLDMPELKVSAKVSSKR
jgi:hypothetical protein